ncbi:uncharacterized protein LAJ45_05154 [Morchella importuna]|uniref:uncharacterized protein n=1 Tax=Morchella importuna TaxID=1174673 RepID=UPI001E8E1EF7|nr:uncharacterized protein LAJ45_05154 [Morchella importuna]KAH8150971.1 hypothetical protein LAJ45_05154 [Morchella importuna]
MQSRAGKEGERRAWRMMTDGNDESTLNRETAVTPVYGNNHFELEIVERLRFIGLRGVVARLIPFVIYHDACGSGMVILKRNNQQRM